MSNEDKIEASEARITKAVFPNTTNHYATLFGALALCLFLIVQATPSPAAEELPLPWTMNVYFENDLFSGTDRNYTNGVKISLISPELVSFVESGKLPDWSLEYVYRLPFINDPDPALRRKVEFSLGQNMYTPADISRSDLIVDDRPYAGCYAGWADIFGDRPRFYAAEMKDKCAHAKTIPPHHTRCSPFM